MADIQDQDMKQDREPVGIKTRIGRLFRPAVAGLVLATGATAVNAEQKVGDNLENKGVTEIILGNPNSALDALSKAGATMSPEQQTDIPNTNLFPVFPKPEASTLPTATATKTPDGNYLGLTNLPDSLVKQSVNYNLVGTGDGQIVTFDFHNLEGVIDEAKQLNVVQLPMSNGQVSYGFMFPQDTQFQTSIGEKTLPANSFMILNPESGQVTINQPVPGAIIAVFEADVNMQQQLASYGMNAAAGTLITGGVRDDGSKELAYVDTTDGERKLADDANIQPAFFTFGGAYENPAATNNSSLMAEGTFQSVDTASLPRVEVDGQERQILDGVEFRPIGAKANWIIQTDIPGLDIKNLGLQDMNLRIFGNKSTETDHNKQIKGLGTEGALQSTKTQVYNFLVTPDRWLPNSFGLVQTQDKKPSIQFTIDDTTNPNEIIFNIYMDPSWLVDNNGVAAQISRANQQIITNFYFAMAAYYGANSQLIRNGAMSTTGDLVFFAMTSKNEQNTATWTGIDYIDNNHVTIIDNPDISIDVSYTPQTQ